MKDLIESCGQILIVSAIIAFTAIGCDTAGVSDPIEDGEDKPINEKPPPSEPPGTVVYSVFTDDNKWRIEYAPFDALDKAVVISPTNGSYKSPRISTDGSKVLFVVQDGPQYSYSWQALVSDIETGSVESIRSNGPYARGLMFPDMESIVWNTSSDGFYYSQRNGVSGAPDFRYYSLLDNSTVHVRDEAIIAYTMISADTLVASDYNDPEVGRGFYLLDPSGRHLSTVEIDTLTSIYGAENSWHVSNHTWNRIRRLMAFEISTQSEDGVRIAISDLNGERFRFVSGQSGLFDNEKPRWGPNGQLVFERTGLRDFDSENSKLMVFDMDADQLRVFLSPDAIDGVQGVSFLDYAR